MDPPRPRTASSDSSIAVRESLYASRALSSWTFLTNHAHVLLCIARDPAIRLRDVATEVQITERAAQRIVAELVEAGYISRTREGRRNHYEVHGDLPLRHPLMQHRRVGDLLDLVSQAPPAAQP